MKQGLVVSDLHIFSRRSNPAQYMDQLNSALAKSDMLVLNGDTFDFRWSTLPSIDQTIIEAMAWIQELSDRFPDCHIQVVCGNHDCRNKYINALIKLSDKNSKICWHEHYLHLENLLFLHGDCDHRHTRFDRFVKRTEPYAAAKKVSNVLSMIYQKADQSGLTGFAQRLTARPKRSAKRVFSYMNGVAPNILDNVEHVYFGHSHVPFTDFKYNGLFFHNTGCAVKNTTFNPIQFLYKG